MKPLPSRTSCSLLFSSDKKPSPPSPPSSPVTFTELPHVSFLQERPGKMMYKLVLSVMLKVSEANDKLIMDV